MDSPFTTKPPWDHGEAEASWHRGERRVGAWLARFVTPLDSKLPGYLLDAYAAVQTDQPSAPPPDRSPASRADHAACGTQRSKMINPFIFKSGRIIVLERGFRWDSGSERDPIEPDRMAARCAVQGLTSLCEGLIRPMSFGVTRQWVDDEFGYPSGVPGPSGKPPRPNWFVKTPQAPAEVTSGYVDPQVMAPVALDERSMLALVDRALDYPCTAPDGDHLAWDELRVDHGWARLPEPERHLEDGELHVEDHDNGSYRTLIPLERAEGHLWVTAPYISVWQPFLLRVYKPFGTKYPDGLELDEIICMEITVNWSFWWEPGEGRTMLDRGVDRLLQQGWRDARPHPDTPLQ